MLDLLPLNLSQAEFLKEGIQGISQDYNEKLNLFLDERDNKIIELQKNKANKFYKSNTESNSYTFLKNNYYNEALAALVKNSRIPKKIEKQANTLVRILEPIFYESEQGRISFGRSHFCAPAKYLINNQYLDTYYYNIFVLVAMCIALYVALYLDVIKKLILLFNITSKS